MNAVLSAPSFDEVRPGPAVVAMLRRSFVVKVEHGLHARLCAILVKKLQPYRAIIEIEANGEKASGKSILGLMALGAGHGAKVMFSIMGEDAPEAMLAVERLFVSDFQVA
jgi:phosphotransferase system HPr (HPr) family protein